MIKLPPQPLWVQTNRSDILGSMFGSFNIDLTKVVGNTRATRMLQTTTQTTNTSLTSYPVGFKYFNDSGNTKIWTVAGSKVHSSASATTKAVFTTDAGVTTNSPTTCDSTASDIEVFNGSLYVTTYDGGGDKLYKKTAGGNWDTGNTQGLGSTSGTHMLTVYGATPRLYISRGNNRIYSMDTSDTIATSSTYTLDLGSTYYVTVMRPASNRIWVCTVVQGGKGYVFEWDGASQNYTRGYRLESAGALACVIKDDTPWIIDTNGRLMVYSNGTFIEKARLPLNNKLLANANNTVNNRFIHPNGMTVIDGRINILINNVLGDNGSSINEFCPSGVWEYDETIGLYHKFSPSYTAVGSTTITDYGQNRLSGVGAISEMKLTDSSANATGSLLLGATVYTNASSTDVGIFTNDTLENTTGSNLQTQKSSYIVTTKVLSPNIKENWQKVWTKHKQMLTSASKITVKYRNFDYDATSINITWVDTQTFTTTTNVLGLEGYEVEVLQGTGSGYMAHISSIDNNNTYYTVHLDDTFTGVTTGTAEARIQGWTKSGTFSGDQLDQEFPFPIEAMASWIQLKIHLVFSTNDELSQLFLINDVNQKAQ